MPENMFLIVSLRKEIESSEQGESIYALLLEWLEQYPNVEVSGRISQQLTESPS